MTGPPSEWGLWIYDGTVASDNAGGANVNINVTGVAGAAWEVLYGMIENQEGASARNTRVHLLHEGDLDLPLLVDASQAAGTERAFPIADPEADASTISAGAPLLMAGIMRLVAVGTSFGQNATMRLALVCRIWGPTPVVTVNVSAGAATETVAKEQVQ